MPPKDPIKNSPAPKIGDVRNVVDGTTTYYTKNNINLPVTDPQKKANTPVITPESLQSANAPVVTPVPPATQAPKLMADIEAQQEDLFNQKLAADKEAASQSKGTALEAYLEQVRGAKGLSTLTAEAYATPNGVNAITPELNDINDQIRREQLALRRATEGVTKAGGQSKAQAQAQINNFTRESLAKQADLAVIQQMVQGRYDSAKEIADRAVDAQLEQQKQAIDIAKFDYEENKDLFTKAEQREYDSLFADRQRRLEEIKQNAADIKSFALSALQAGASTAEVQKAMQAKTMDEAIALVGSYLRPKPAATSASAPTIKTINGVDYQWNAATGSWEIPSVDGTPVGAGGQSLENLNTKYTELLKDIGDATTLANTGAVGAGKAERIFKSIFTSNADYKQVENIADTIKANLLTLNTDPAIKKFFGPQMSNRDTELMTGAASTLNPEKQTPEQFKRDLQDAAGVIARAREAVRQGLGQGPAPTFTPNPNGLAAPLSQQVLGQTIVVAPDGMEIEIVD